MSKITAYILTIEEELEKEDKLSDDPKRVLTEDSLLPEDDERDDYKGAYHRAWEESIKASRDPFLYNLWVREQDAKSLPKI